MKFVLAFVVALSLSLGAASATVFWTDATHSPDHPKPVYKKQHK